MALYRAQWAVLATGLAVAAASSWWFLNPTFTHPVFSGRLNVNKDILGGGSASVSGGSATFAADELVPGLLVFAAVLAVTVLMVVKVGRLLRVRNKPVALEEGLVWPPPPKPPAV